MVISYDREPPEPGGADPVLVTLAEAGAAPAQSDAELVSAIAAGERAALAALYDRYATTMLALAQRIVGMRTLAEDLVHDLFIEVWQTAPAYDAARGSVRTWLIVRLRSRALDRVRSAAWRAFTHGAPVEAALTSSADPGVEGDYLRQVTRAQLQGAVRTLSQEERELVALIYGQGLPLNDAAVRLGVPLGTTKSRLRRVLAKLRQCLAGYPDEV